MKKFAAFLVPVAIISIFLYQFWDKVVAVAAPCTKPISYTLGTFDKQFGISQEYFLSALADAESVWEKQSGKELFAYSAEDGILKVNLVYDYRQQATDKLKNVDSSVKDDRQTYDALKVKYNREVSELEAMRASFASRNAAYDAREKKYEEDVTYWNARGGAPEEEYSKLQAEESALDREVAQLESTQNKINQKVDAINIMVVELNRLVGVLNLSANEYNNINKERGESFEEGIYESDGWNRKIDIYEFSNREKLVRVLAHELGHALGLDHVEDDKAIMYAMNESDSLILSAADIAALNQVCGVEQ